MNSRCFLLIGFLPLLPGMFTGCQTTREVLATQPAPPTSGRKQWMIHDGESGSAVEWGAFLGQLAKADIIAIGERHDDEVGHAVEAAIVSALLKHKPSGAVAMEMFERDEQGIVDLYLDGEIKRSTLVKITDSANWGGEDTWDGFYQPMVDAVKTHRSSGAALVAANSPRAYVTMARTDGFDPLRRLRREGNRDFALPDLKVDESAYRARFFEFMGEPAAAGDLVHAQDSRAGAFFRAQQMWDATMADSVVKASRRHPQVVLIAGDFHVADEGGTLVRIRARSGWKKVKSVSIVPVKGVRSLKEEHRGRADFVVYTKG
jgi:uncharacterized iron-regulated protein